MDARIPISSGSRFITRGDHVHLLERLPTLPKGAKLKLPNTTAAEIAPLTPFTHLVRCDMGTQLTLVPIDFAPSPVTTSSSTSMTFFDSGTQLPSLISHQSGTVCIRTGRISHPELSLLHACTLLRTPPRAARIPYCNGSSSSESRCMERTMTA